MLMRLLRTYLRKYRRALVLVLVFQLFQTIAALYLPNLNASIIDNGIFAAGGPDQAYIWRLGAVMLGVSFLQVIFTITAVYWGSRAAMGFGRDLRAGLFHQVTDYSAQEINAFGAPSLITRITNDVQQVQILVLMTFTLLVSAPLMAIGGVFMALREDVGLSLILVVAVPVLGCALALVVRRMVPLFRKVQERIDDVNRVLREQITGMRVVRAFVREPDEAERLQEII
jgi:ATP-binding cassette subfamily B protein